MSWVTGSLGEQEEVSSSKFFEGYHDFSSLYSYPSPLLLYLSEIYLESIFSKIHHSSIFLQQIDFSQPFTKRFTHISQKSLFHLGSKQR